MRYEIDVVLAESFTNIVYQVAEILDVRVATAPAWRRNKRRANPQAGWIVHELIDFFESDLAKRNLEPFARTADEVMVHVVMSNDSAFDDPFGGTQADQPSAPNALRAEYLREATNYHKTIEEKSGFNARKREACVIYLIRILLASGQR